MMIKKDYETLYWQFFNEIDDNSHTFKEYKILNAIMDLLKNLAGRVPGEGVPLFAIGKSIEELDNFTYTTEQLEYVVHAHFPTDEYDKLPWEKSGMSSDDQRCMIQSQKEANLTKAYMDTFNRPSIARYL